MPEPFEERGVAARLDIVSSCQQEVGFTQSLFGQTPYATAAPSTQWNYSSVSRASLRKTGVFLDSARDFWEFSAQKVRTAVSRGYWRREKPAFRGPFSSKEGISPKRGMAGWGGRIRTSL